MLKEEDTSVSIEQTTKVLRVFRSMTNITVIVYFSCGIVAREIANILLKYGPDGRRVGAKKGCEIKVQLVE